jgi:hypothetical protein
MPPAANANDINEIDIKIDSETRFAISVTVRHRESSRSLAGSTPPP